MRPGRTTDGGHAVRRQHEPRRRRDDRALVRHLTLALVVLGFVSVHAAGLREQVGGDDGAGVPGAEQADGGVAPPPVRGGGGGPDAGDRPLPPGPERRRPPVPSQRPEAEDERATSARVLAVLREGIRSVPNLVEHVTEDLESLQRLLAEEAVNIAPRRGRSGCSRPATANARPEAPR